MSFNLRPSAPFPVFGNHPRGNSGSSYAQELENRRIRTLKSISFRRIILSLHENRYSHCGCSGPFTFLPSSIVNELFTKVSEAQEVSLLSLLLIVRSNRMTHLELTFRSRITAKEFILLCRAMVPFAASLTEISIHTFYPLDQYPKFCTKGLDKLLAAAHHLKTLKTAIPFKFRVLRSLKQLEHLEVNFFFNQFKPKIKKSIFHKENILRYIYIQDCGKLLPKKKELAAVLSSCPHLLELKNDLAETLEFLHGSNPHSCPRYALQNVVLGKSVAGACSQQVQLAASTCPDIVGLDLITGDRHALLHISEMKRLQNLKVTWMEQAGDFEEVLHPSLKDMKHQLRHLSVSRFFNVNFNAFLLYGSLVELEVYIPAMERNVTGETKKSLHIRRLDSSDHSCFSRLQVLRVCFPSMSEEETDALCDIIFTRAPRLQRLHANLPPRFLRTDDLSTVLPVHSHLLHVALFRPPLSTSAILFFVRQCPALEEFYFTAYPELTTADQEQIRNELMPSKVLWCLGFLKWKILKVT